MKVDLLVAEIGSTTTVVNAFSGVNTSTPAFLGQGQGPTTVEDGDMNVGLKQALANLAKGLQEKGLLQEGEELSQKRMLATSSAAGGLKMTVHGLVQEMTARAAREAALGAGAVLKMVTAGKMRERHLEEITGIRPNIILLAGGVDYGEEETIIHNAHLLSKLELDIPVIYAGNKAIKKEVEEILISAGKRVILTENVYPGIDEFNVEPTRKIIQQVFEEHIIHAPGMERIAELVDGSIMPTPGAVMEAARLLYEDIGDLMVIDVGGATTDVHSVTEGTPKIQDLMVSPEPKAKRTVEGDLGVFVNAPNVVEMIGKEVLEEELGFPVAAIIKDRMPIPTTEEETRVVERMTREVVRVAVDRHAGEMRNIYGPTGRVTIARGKDLTGVKWIIGTGGALTRLDGSREILGSLRRGGSKKLMPGPEARVELDRYYIMASLGVASLEHKEFALAMLKQSLGL
ncbi:MAG: GlmL-related ornithine degradation protein [Halanaerobium sp.]|nr:GlmL-related ornithine degradation protein [Halanaerobium sp.]